MRSSEYNANLPLRYKISDWHQLTKCKSNNSNKLKIEVSDFIQDNRLNGVRISIVHSDFGPLFTCVLNATGSIVDSLQDNITFEFTPIQILSELSKYGFLVTYKPVEVLPSSQLDYLITLSQLGYDKIRILNVYSYVGSTGDKSFKWYVVAFNADKNKYWLNNDYSPSDKEFVAAMKNGSAMNISGISKTKSWSWSWLYGYVANILDVLEDNA